MIARVVVMPKPAVNDPQGMTVRQALRALGFDEVADVRVGKYLEVTLEEVETEQARRRLQEMCERLLANQVVEDFRFDLDPAGHAGSLPS